MAAPGVFAIGNINLGTSIQKGFETKPPLTNAGGVEEMIVTNFPGGTKTVQLMGSFLETMTWSGMLLGQDAMSRAMQLDGLRTDEQPVVLQFEEWSWFGVVKKVDLNVNNRWEIDYTFTFEPVANDNSGGMTAPAFDAQSQLAQAFDIGNQQVTNPSSNYTFAPGIQQSFSSIQQNANQAIQQNNQNLNSVPLSTIKNIQKQIINFQAQLAPLMASPDPFVSSSATVLNNTATIISRTLSQAGPIQAELNVQDPNLPALAAQYLGSASAWTDIVDANPGVLPLDPQPLGTFTIVIPSESQQIASNAGLWQ